MNLDRSESRPVTVGRLVGYLPPCEHSSTSCAFPGTRANERKHRIGFEEAITVFVDPLARVFDDPDHSEREHRFLLVGRSLTGRLLLVVHVERGDTIRIIIAQIGRAHV